MPDKGNSWGNYVKKLKQKKKKKKKKKKKEKKGTIIDSSKTGIINLQ